MTEKNLHDAFAGESQAHMKYLNFSARAEKDGFPAVAKLFKAISFAEQVHASSHLRTLGEIKSTAENLQAAIDGENFEVDEMYPAYDAVANLQGEKDAVRSIHYAVEAEKVHAKMYMDAKSSVAGGKDISVKSVHVCKVCGFTAVDGSPHKCPVCGAPQSQFESF
jgi:rubrerythrin